MSKPDFICNQVSTVNFFGPFPEDCLRKFADYVEEYGLEWEDYEDNIVLELIKTNDNREYVLSVNLVDTDVHA